MTRGKDLSWRTIYLSATSSGNANQLFTVPKDRIYHIQSILATVTTDANAVDRTIRLKISSDDSDDELATDVRAGALQVASVTRYYNFAPDATRMTAFADTDWLTVPIPDTILTPGSVIIVEARSSDDTLSSSDDVEIRALVSIAATKGTFWNVP